MTYEAVHFVRFAMRNPGDVAKFLISKVLLKLRLVLSLNKKHKDRLFQQKTDEHTIFIMRLRHSIIESISPTLCNAKWLQLTLNLQNGMNHSCHHPAPHKIPLQELALSPRALHNTNFKKEQRRLMLNGERPNECEYCWSVEDRNPNHLSDRVYKNSDPKWSFNHRHAITQSGSTEDLTPTYLEVSFENTCNLACSYCVPENSSTWTQEIKKYGAYPTSYKHGDPAKQEYDGRKIYNASESNPYVESFWQWWPELIQKLEVFRITGGEPLLSSSTWKVLDRLIEEPRPNLDLAINSNLSISKEILNRFITKINSLHEKIKSLTIYTSCEAHGSQAEYIRYGLNYSEFLANIDQLLKETPDHIKVSFIMTFNALSVTSFLPFLEDLKALRNKFKTKSHERVEFMIAHLRWPHHMSVQVLPRDIRQSFVASLLSYIQNHSIAHHDNGHLHETEVDQLNRLCEFILGDMPKNKLEEAQKDFKLFFNEYDRRKNTSFQKTFPELQ